MSMLMTLVKITKKVQFTLDQAANALDGGWSSTPRPGRFTPGEIHGTHRGPQGRSGRVQKILPPPDDTGTCILMQQVCK
jgi:hypothetical protein